MSKVAITGNENGTGVFTIAAPNSSTDRTLTLPDAGGTILHADSSGDLTVSNDLIVSNDLTVTGTVNSQTISDSGWIFVGDTGAPAFENSWQDYDGDYTEGGYGSCRFRKINGVVYLEGLATSGTVGSTIFTLPAGYRPFGIVITHSLTSGNGSSRLDVNTSGNVICNTGSNSWFSIWCSFVAHQ